MTKKAKFAIFTYATEKVPRDKSIRGAFENDSYTEARFTEIDRPLNLQFQTADLEEHKRLRVRGRAPEKKMSTYRINVFAALILVMSILVEIGNTQSSIYPYEEKRQSTTLHKYCGQNLSNALRLLCDGVYNSIIKKNVQEMAMEDYPYSDELYPFRSAVIANAMMGHYAGRRFRRQSRGAFDECCLKPCSIQELNTYCGRRQ